MASSDLHRLLSPECKSWGCHNKVHIYLHNERKSELPQPAESTKLVCHPTTNPTTMLLDV